MIIDHCYKILVNGNSPFTDEQLDSNEQVLDTLTTGLKIRRLNGLKAALIMLEIMHNEQKHIQTSQLVKYLDHFITWAVQSLSMPMVLALVKYAIRDRNLTFKNQLSSSAGFRKLTTEFKQFIFLDDEEAEAVLTFRRMTKFYNAITHNRGLTAATAEAVDSVYDYAV
jgi:hypothetical protein